jgi:hypothetical protein
MNRNDVACVWLIEDAISIELNDGKIWRELFSEYSRRPMS